jgi:hypothetical protein
MATTTEPTQYTRLPDSAALDETIVRLEAHGFSVEVGRVPEGVREYQADTRRAQHRAATDPADTYILKTNATLEDFTRPA